MEGRWRKCAHHLHGPPVASARTGVVPNKRACAVGVKIEGPEWIRFGVGYPKDSTLCASSCHAVKLLQRLVRAPSRAQRAATRQPRMCRRCASEKRACRCIGARPSQPLETVRPHCIILITMLSMIFAVLCDRIIIVKHDVGCGRRPRQRKLERQVDALGEKCKVWRVHHGQNAEGGTRSIVHVGRGRHVSWLEYRYVRRSIDRTRCIG